MEKLVIFGSSWSEGEWGRSDPGEFGLQVTHPGMTEYLSDTYKVVNFSKSGSSLWQILYAIHNYCDMSFIDREEAEVPAKIIVFQNDPFISTLSEKFDVDYQKIFKECVDINALYQMLVEMFYIKLSEIQRKYNIDVYLCGAISDVDPRLAAYCPNLKVLCSSWVKLLDPTHTPSIIPLNWYRDTLPVVRSYGRMDLCEEIINISDNNFKELQTRLECEYIGREFGDYHPNRQGHEIMSNYIKDYFRKTEQ